MQLVYKVKADTREWSETRLNLKDERFNNEFSNENPLIARQQAFDRAKSFLEIFLEANKAGTESFFDSKNEVYKDFSISVVLIDAESSQEIEIDICEPYDKLGLEDRYDFITLQSVISGLEREVEIYRKNNVSQLRDVIKHVKIISPEGTKTIEIIPTEYINSAVIKLSDESELL